MHCSSSPRNRFFITQCLPVTFLALLGAADNFASGAEGDFPNPDTKGLPPRTLLRRPAPRPIPTWQRTHLRNGHLPGYSDRMVKEFLKAGYNVVTVNCLTAWDHVGPAASWYPPDDVKRADAYLRKVVDTIHAGKAKAMFYIGPVQSPLNSKEICKAHPEWLPVGRDGKALSPPNFGNIRTAYTDWMLAQLAYLVKTYKVDGFWLDGYAPGHLHAYDEKARQMFRDFSGGKEIPPLDKLDPVTSPLARQYLAWHEQYVIDLADRMRAAVRKENPEVVLFANHSGNRTWYFPGERRTEYPGCFSGAVDVSSIELYWDVPADALYQQLCCAYMQGVTRDRGASVWIQPTAHGISGTASPIDIQLRGLEGAPWGVYPEFVESANREEYLKLHAANVKARDAWWIQSEAVPYVGIVASEQTRALYGRGAMQLYFSHTLGAFRAIFEKHWPVRVLTEYDLEDGALGGVRVLMLPNVACLSARSAEVVRRFVKQGGGLVVSGATSLYDENFQRRKDFALADLFQASYQKTHVVAQRQDNLYLSLDVDHPILNDPIIRSRQMTAWVGGDGPPPKKGTLALIAGAVEVKAREGGQVLSTFRKGGALPDQKPYPAIIASTRGKGRVVYFPAGVDKGMFFYPDAYMRQMLANASLWAAGGVKPPVQVDGPLILAATFRRQPDKNRLVVHLLNDHSSYGRHSASQKLTNLPRDLQLKWGYPSHSELRGTWPTREEVIPLHDIKVICRVPSVTQATLQPENLKLPLKRIADGVEVIVPRVSIHSMVVFELKPK